MSEASPGGIDPSAPIPSSQWEGCSAPELARWWELPEVHVFSEIGSTNDAARTLASIGAPNGTLIIAEKQNSGRGRGARLWSSLPGLGLWCSLVVRRVPAESISQLPLRVALGIARALDPWTDGATQIKWPNDLWVNGLKIGGILCEASWDRSNVDHVVIGIGLNLLHNPGDFPDEIRPIATSLRLVSNRAVSRFDVATEVIGQLHGLLLSGRMVDDLPLDEIAARDALIHKEIEVFEPETGKILLLGNAVGIDSDGALIVDEGTGLKRVKSGTVRVRGMTS